VFGKISEKCFWPLLDSPESENEKLVFLAFQKLLLGEAILKTCYSSTLMNFLQSSYFILGLS